MLSWGHTWEERIRINSFLTHYLEGGIRDDMFGSETEGNGVFKGEKKLQKKNLFHKMQSVENLSAECQD